MTQIFIIYILNDFVFLFLQKVHKHEENVSQLMKSKKISQETLSEALGISVWTLRSFISKQILPRVDVAWGIAEFLGTSVEFLLSGKESNEYKKRLDNLKKQMTDLIESEGK